MLRSISILIVSLCLLVSFVQPYDVEQLPSPQCGNSKNPHWDQNTRSLYYVDVVASKSYLLRYDYDENRVYQATIDNATTLVFMLPIEGAPNHFLVGIDLKAVTVFWDGRSPKAVVNSTSVFEIDEDSSHRINVVKTDRFGRFYGGSSTMKSCATVTVETAAFYKYTKSTGLIKNFGDVLRSNGLTWNRSSNKFYYADSCDYNVVEFDWDPDTGNLTNGTEIFSLAEYDTKPGSVIDGITGDLDGNIYMAIYGDNQIIKLNPTTREVLLKIDMPMNQSVGVEFGGPNLDILFVTTRYIDGKQPNGSGHLFKITGLKTTGHAGVKVDLS
ncbi:regucalcin-like [Contarinia nasturtii]|uniref:regucalcin-like n=1 Tax=Contarinia nasturtii TaxID=265458 RepID=UPI0012D42C0A|nr:regucalcin-like [Contarinia nasturtii]